MVSLKELTRVRIGGKPKKIITAEDENDILKALENNLKVIGGGTKILAKDGKLDFTLLKLGGSFRWIEVKGDIVRCGAGTPLSTLVREGTKRGFKGVEALAGIPGTVGGAVAMNSGTKLGTTFDFIQEVEVITEAGKKRLRKGEINFGHRRGVKEGVIISATFKFESDEGIKEAVREAIREKAKKQPLSGRNFGCIFKNPGAGKIIDELGLKCFRVGGIKISEVHANFVENFADATFKDAIKLIEEVRRRVLEEKGIYLEEEVIIWT